MIKILKLQKAVVAFILGVLALVGFKIMSEQEMEESKYLLTAAGVFFIIGALLFLYPILFAKKDKAGLVELDPELNADAEATETKRLADK
jgi:VIT1/CCC1 family predicted Fe2+/Mn2+ transporter